VAPCRSCVNRRFGGTYRLHLQGKKSASEEPARAGGCSLSHQFGKCDTHLTLSRSSLYGTIRIYFLFCLPSAMDNARTALRTDNRHARKDSTCGIDGATALTSFREFISTKTPIAEARKALQFHRVSTPLMMVE
jgi:hypothetical protein